MPLHKRQVGSRRAQLCQLLLVGEGESHAFGGSRLGRRGIVTRNSRAEKRHA
jgi:hypothetical protein